MGGADAFEAMRLACDQLVSQLGSARPPIKLAPLARLMGLSSITMIAQASVRKKRRSDSHKVSSSSG
jgi:hypothetical protein